MSDIGIKDPQSQCERGTWRHHQPTFDLKMPNQPMARRMDALLQKHDWSRNLFIAQLRRNGADLRCGSHPDGSPKIKHIAPRRASIRAEREQTFKCLARAIIYRTNYDPNAPYLFEVTASVEDLAGMIGQLHKYQPNYDEAGIYRHGRKSCDPVHGALLDWEAAGMAVVVREFDQSAGTYKASRIFLTPKWFKGLGMTLNDTRKMLAAARRWQEKNGLVESNRDKRRAHVLRIAESDRVARMNRPALKNLLAQFRREFTGDNRHEKRVNDAAERVKKAAQEQYKSTSKISDDERELRRLKSLLMPVKVWDIENQIKQSTGLLSGPEFNKLLITALRELE